MKYLSMIIASIFAGIFVCTLLYFFSITFLPEELNPTNSSIAIVFSSTMALSSALFTVANNNRTNIEKNTLDVIGKDKGLIGPEFLFIKEYLQKNSTCKELAMIELAQNCTIYEEMIPIMKTLNELEHLCEGAIKGFYDLDILRNTRGGSIVHIWETFKPYIFERRRVQIKRLGEGHQFIGSKESNIPFYWLEKCYPRIIGKSNEELRVRKELMFGSVAILLLFIPFIPPIICMFFYF
ncbi:DUF4760 domain-containing protein [Shewanella insulae]|uniref:DUF4760 domain-containing protein n=1 Tax=Shewanella insulae TaxID=2681496 RepID=UPI00247FA988|nr:DUF4760 domain-containing protein [Shewanella insulae]